MDVRYELVRYCFAFVLGMLAVGVLWKGELTVFSAADAPRRQSRRFTGPVVRCIGAGWLVAALLGLHSLFACGMAFMAVTLIGVLVLVRQP